MLRSVSVRTAVSVVGPPAPGGEPVDVRVVDVEPALRILPPRQVAAHQPHVRLVVEELHDAHVAKAIAALKLDVARHSVEFGVVDGHDQCPGGNHKQQIADIKNNLLQIKITTSQSKLTVKYSWQIKFMTSVPKSTNSKVHGK